LEGCERGCGRCGRCLAGPDNCSPEKAWPLPPARLCKEEGRHDQPNGVVAKRRERLLVGQRVGPQRDGDACGGGVGRQEECKGLRSAGGAVLLGRRCSNGASARPGRGPPPAPRGRSPTSAVGGMGSGSRIRPGGDGGAVEGRTGGAQPPAAPPLRLARPGQQLPAPTRQQGAPLGRLLDPSRGDPSATCAAPLTQDGGHEDRKQPPALRRQLRRPRHREVQD
jgi:hypothetical protein